MKKLTFFGLFALSLLLVAGLSSAYSYGWDYSPYNSYDDYYKETKTIKTRDVDYFNDRYGYGKATTTTNKKVVVERYDYPYADRYDYRDSCDKYYYNYDCSGYPRSNYRYEPVYNYRTYGDDNYGQPYYYEPRYDWHLGYYNWRY